MPMYDVEHDVQLSDSQKDRLAEAITKLHSDKFKRPRMFVNVAFRDMSAVRQYVGGKHRPNNRVIASVRYGPLRTQSMYDELCTDIAALWKEVVGTGPDKELRSVFVYGALVTAYEGGYLAPLAGRELEWVSENFEDIEKRAKAGDADCKLMIEDLQSRSDFSEAIEWSNIGPAF